jgi:adenosylmethionine-8-amino-7-oxononanoate aminotransferase
MIWACDVVDAPADFAARYHRHALARGLLLRPIGNTVYAMPPYLLEPDEVRHLGAAAHGALQDTLAEAGA